ncbi:MAG: LPS assembly protein LptD, partial [Nitrospinae bacterium]|nr:LPS assembly protein LptD [Nitrospinota bacterium]
YTRTKPYTDSNATVSADSGPWYMSLTGRDNRGIDQVSTEELSKQPEVKLAFLPHAFYNTPLWLSGDAVGTSFYSTALPGASTLNRVDVSPTISTPFNLTRFFNVTPYVGGHQTYYDNNTKNTGPVSTSYYTTGLGIEGPRIFKIFKAKSDSYKHTITPKLDYVYIPGYEVDGTDRLKAVQMDGVDNSSPQSVLSFTLLNRVFSKKRGDEIFWLSLQQGYDFNQVPGAGTGTSVASSTVGTPTTPGPYVPLQFQLRSKPVGYFIFNMDMAFNHYLGIPDTMSQELGFAAPESAFYLSLDRSYSRQTLSVSPTGISTYFTQATTFDSGLLGFRISSKYSAEASAIYDEILQTYAGTMFALKFNSCCWGATLNAGTHPTTILNSNGTLSQTTETKFSFSINLKGIGDIGEKATPLLARKL